MNSELKIAAPIAGAIITFFYFSPKIPEWLVVLFFCASILFFFMDAKITLKHSLLIKTHELNPFFPILYSKFGKVSPYVQFLIELCLIVALAAFLQSFRQFEWHVLPEASSVVGFGFGMAHLEAYFTNKKRVKKLADV